MKKRILSLLLVFVLLCGTWSIASVNAYSETDIAYPVEGGNIYFDKASGKITDCDEGVTKAEIPAAIDGVAVEIIGSSAFSGCKNLINVVIPDSVWNIYPFAFSNCEKLGNVTLPNSVRNIGTLAFQCCRSMTSVTLPASVLRVDRLAFFRCVNLTEILVDENSKSFSNDEYGVLFDKEKTKLVAAPAKISGDYAIPEGVTTLVCTAFEECTNLTSIAFPASMTTIEKQSPYDTFLYGCKALKEIYVDEANQSFSTDAYGILFDKEKTELLWFPAAFTGDYSIPESVMSIATGAFRTHNGLTGIEIPGSISKIDTLAFAYCRALRSITLSEGVKSIDLSAFQGCGSLTSITIPASVTKLDEKAFHDCMALTSVYFMGDAPEIGWGVFQTCDGTHKNEENIPGLTLYYIDGKAGWTTPLWNGYPTATWKIGHEHSYVETVTAPTCTEKGYTTHICECGDSYVDSYVDALGHTWDAGSVAKEPTCTDKGYMTYSCTACGESYVEAYHDALGHAWDNGVVTKEPTEKEAGEKTFTCARCKATQTERIPATGEQTDKPCDGGVSCPSKKFVDVNTKEWYHLYVDYAVVHGLFGGTSANTFEPETAMTRAMLVTVLWRYEGQPKGYQNNFSDVNAKDGGWYIDAVAWAAANDVVNGVGDGKFDPEGNITREQMAVILYRYAEKKGIDTSKRGALDGFSDSGKVSPWAKDAVQWAVAEKIINGSDGKLLPQGDATRAQVATILMRFIENIVKK